MSLSTNLRGGGGTKLRQLAKGLSAALIGAALALLALSNAGADYRLAAHPTSGDCVYLNTAGALDDAGQWVYTAAQAKDAETCTLPAPPPPVADTAADLAADREGLVGVARAIGSTTVSTVLTAHGEALRLAEEAVATARSNLAQAEGLLAGAPNQWVRNLLNNQVNANRQALANAEANVANLSALDEPRTRTIVTRHTTQYVEIDSDGDGVWETHNCAGREIGNRVLPVGTDDDGNDLPYAAELRRVCGVS